MAASIACRRATSTASPLLKRLINATSLRPAAAAPSQWHSFNTNAQRTAHDDDDRGVDVDRRSERGVSRSRDFPSFFSDVFDPFSPPRSVSQLRNMMDQFMENPFLGSRGLGGGAGSRRPWDVREDNEALHLRMDMPGLDKENVEISVDQNTLVIKGKGEKETEDEESRSRYSTRIDLPPNLYKIDGIKAKMTNGVLKVIVPKVKEDERKDVFQVSIE